MNKVNWFPRQRLELEWIGKEMNWFVEQRMKWIAEMLYIYGFINREHLQRKFRISQPQASLDLAAFQREFPSAIHYDDSEKRYVAGKP